MNFGSGCCLVLILNIYRISQTSSNTEGRKETEKETEEGKEKRERKKDSNVKTTALFFNISDRINIQDDH